MVKELDVCVRVPCPPRLLLRLLHSDDGCFVRSLHAAVTHDAAASVTPWLAGKRTVHFTKTLDLPAALLKLLGDLSAMPVVEQQELLVAPTVATVTSTAASKGFEKFKTSISTTITPAQDSQESSLLRQVIRVEAPFIPGFQSLIERQMASIAAESLEAANSHALAFVAAHLAQSDRSEPHKLAAEPASPARVRTPRASLSPLNGGEGALTRSTSLKRRREGEGGTPTAGAQADDAGASPAAGLARSASLRRRVGGQAQSPLSPAAVAESQAKL